MQIHASFLVWRRWTHLWTDCRSVHPKRPREESCWKINNTSFPLLTLARSLPKNTLKHPSLPCSFLRTHRTAKPRHRFSRHLQNAAFEIPWHFHPDTWRSERREKKKNHTTYNKAKNSSRHVSQHQQHHRKSFRLRISSKLSALETLTFPVSL